MKSLITINETTAIAFAVETDVKRVLVDEEQIRLVEYKDTLLNFLDKEECDRFVDGYNEKLSRLNSAMTENNFLRDIREYCFLFGVTVNPINGERIDQTKRSYQGAKEFGSYYK